MVKLVVSDLDGTLLNDQHQISPYTLNVIDRLFEHDIKFAVATGRHYRDIHYLRSVIRQDIYWVTSNGAVVHNKEGDCIRRETISASVAREMISLSQNYQVHRNVHSGDEWYADSPNEGLLDYHELSGFVYTVVDLDSLDYNSVSKCYFVGDKAELLAFGRHLGEVLGDSLSVTYSLWNTLEVMSKGISKATALEHVFKEKSVEAEHTMAFGDGLNDLEMLQLVGHSVVMENAQPELKTRLGNFLEAGHHQEHGVAKYLERHVLAGQ